MSRGDFYNFHKMSSLCRGPDSIEYRHNKYTESHVDECDKKILDLHKKIQLIDQHEKTNRSDISDMREYLIGTEALQNNHTKWITFNHKYLNSLGSKFLLMENKLDELEQQKEGYKKDKIDLQMVINQLLQQQKTTTEEIKFMKDVISQQFNSYNAQIYELQQENIAKQIVLDQLYSKMSRVMHELDV